MSVQQLLPIGLALIMLAVGLSLRIKDFKDVVLYPRAFLTGLLNQIILLPAIGFGLIFFYNGSPEFALGIMILAACPGGITSNLLSVLAGGNAALSVSMTAVTSLASIFTVPAVLSISHMIIYGSSAHIDMPVVRVMAGIFVITGVPIILGMTLKGKASNFTKKVQPYVRALATVIFALIVAGAFLANKDDITQHFLDVGISLIALNVITMALGYISARILKLPQADSITICLESGLQNVALAIFIAVNILGKPELMIPAIIYALIMNISAGFIIILVRKTVPENAISGS
jgi:bile acid:Na+ symporter, BASS family